MKKYSISDLSAHLFWDVEIRKINFENNNKIIIQRVLEYGLLDDWNIIFNYYGISKIANIAKGLRDLDDKSAVFVSSLSKIPIEQFRCYITKQSTPKHWNF